MSVDPDIRRMLDGLLAAPPVALAEASVEEMRREYRRQYHEMSLPPDRAVAVAAHPLTPVAGRPSLQVYRPDSLRPNAPAILYLHGGGFVLGDTVTYARQSARIALACSAVVLFLDYRLAPEHKFPAALDDTLLAVQWIVDNHGTLGIDPSRIVAMGDSAGANLAIMAALGSRERPVLRSICALYPVADFRPYVGRADPSASDREFASGFYLDFDEVKFFAGCYLRDAALADDPRVSPVLQQNLAGLPPILMFAAENDVLRDQGRDFADRLRAAGNEVSYRCFGGLIHNFMQHSGVSPRSNEAFLEVCSAVSGAFAGKPVAD